MTNKTRTTEDQQIVEAEYQGRWAAHAGLTLEDFWPVWKGMAAKSGHSAWLGWSEAVDSYLAAKS